MANEMEITTNSTTVSISVDPRYEEISCKPWFLFVEERGYTGPGRAGFIEKFTSLEEAHEFLVKTFHSHSNANIWDIYEDEYYDYEFCIDNKWRLSGKGKDGLYIRVENDGK